MEKDAEVSLMIRRFGLEPVGYDPAGIPAAFFGRGSVGLMQDGEDFYVWVSRWLLDPGWEGEERWSNGYREVLVNTQKRVILTYCEGDVDLTVDGDEETFRKRYAAAEGFYERSN